MTADDKVVPIRLHSEQHARLISIEARQIIDSCKMTMSNRLKTLLQNMMDNADDTLYELAEKSENISTQSIYFDAMRIARFKRQEIEENFNNNVIDLFHDFWRMPTTARRKNSTNELSLDGFELVEETDLEESLAITGLINKVKNRHKQELYAIEQRLAHLLPKHTITEENNPFGPTRICGIFREAIESLDIDIKLKLILYKLFDKYVISRFGVLYSEINQLFIDAGVLPTLKFKIDKFYGDPSEETNNSGPAIEVEPYVDSEASDLARNEKVTPEQSGILQTLYELLAMSHRSLMPPNSGSSRQKAPGTQETAGRDGAVTYAATQDVLSVLSSLQGMDLAANQSSIDRSGGESVRSLLINKFESINDDDIRRSSINPLDNNIIDIVAMMFDFILEDHGLPIAVNALISRLQIPILKVSILDKNFFSKRFHPARKLLNDLAKVGIGLNDENCNENNHVYSKIEYTINRILNEFGQDITLFSELLREFSDFMDAECIREEEIQNSTRRAYEKREQFKLAKGWVAESLKERLGNKKIPDSIKQFVFGPWYEVLLNTYIEEGGDCNPWKEQIRFVDILIWSVKPKKTAIERQRLAGIILQLLDTLRSGLKTISYPDEEIECIIVMLESLHLASFRGMEEHNEISSVTANRKHDFSSVTMTTHDLGEENLKSEQRLVKELNFGITSSPGDIVRSASSDIEELKQDIIIEDIVLSGYEDNNSADSQPDDEYLQLARHLEAGKWVEFIDKDNKKHRAKLAWKSDLLGEYTFLNWKHQVVSDTTLLGLATDLRRGTAKIIDDVPIFDRAINAVVTGLKRQAVG